MHEMAICETLVGLIEQEARHQGIARVRRARLRIGKMAAFELEQLLICLKGMPQQALLRDTTFDIEQVPVTLRCRSCNAATVDARFDDIAFAHRIAHAPEFYRPLPCAACGSTDVTLVAGREREVASVE